MKYSALPRYTSLPDTRLITYEQDKLVTLPAPEIFQEQQDMAIILQVLSRISPDNTLANHINDPGLHSPISDGVVSTGSTWSSARIDSAISGSDPWFSLDSIPEGSVNLYFTQERAKEIIANTTQGIPQIDHETIAGHIVSLLLGFNSTVFRYNAATPNSISVEIDGSGPTIDYFEVTPGEHTVTVSNQNAVFRCDQLGHEVSLTDGTQVITPRLTLDSFKDGSVNKLYSESDFSNSPILSSIDDHLSTGFSNYHAQINDNNSSSLTSTWSSKKILTQFFQEFAKNTPLASHKELSVLHERASSGSMTSSYDWTTDNLNPGFTHYVKRRTSTANWNEAISTSTDEWWLDPGTWYMFWQASEDINPYFANVTNVLTYIALDNFPKIPVLQHPGVVTISSTTNYALVTRFTTTTSYSSSYRNNWLVPRSLPGIDELYSIVHIERIR